jgi:ADP-heptose:LPS heptosyltransferase
MKNILVIQLCRYGDLIQTTPALAALRRRWPEARIHLLARRGFGGVLAGNEDVAERIEWDAAPLDKDWSALPFPERLATLREFVRPLRATKFDLVCNLSNDLPGALLAYLMHPRRTVGLTFCRDRRYRVRDDWSRYLFLSTEVRRMNSLNLAEVLVRACDGDGPTAPKLRVSEEDERFAESVIRKKLFGAPRPPIGIQIGASKDYKRWPPARFRELAARLGAQRETILFFGVADERPAIAAIVDPLRAAGVAAVNMAGETTFGRLAALLKRCRLLISNDTAAIHVAAAVGTPCLALTFSTANAWDTGPYGEGHFVLEPQLACYPCAWHAQCARLACRDQLSVEAVQAAVEVALGRTAGTPKELSKSPVTLYRSAWMSDGFLGLRPVNRPPLGIKDVLRFLHRAHFLDRLLRREASPAADPLADWIGDYRIDDPASLSRQAMAAARDLTALRKLAEVGEQAARAAFDRTTGPASAQGAARLGGAIERLQERVLACEENDALRFLTAGFRHALVDMEARDAREAAAVHRWNYGLLARGCSAIENGLRRFAASLDAEETGESPREGALAFVR